MMGYKDMTFCTYYINCKHADNCRRPLTKEVEKAAEEWWGGANFPIAVFTERPCCWDEKIVAYDTE